jgi:FtsH-binding integral membrane protein
MFADGAFGTSSASWRKGMPLSIRNDFVCKVYCLVTAQLAVAVASGVATMHTLPLLWESLQSGIPLASALLLVILSCLGSREVMRQFPANFAILAAIAVLEGVLLGVFCSAYTAASVLVAAGMTGGIFLALTAFAWTTGSDFTNAGPYLLVTLTGLIMSGLVLCFFPIPVVDAARSGVGALLFCCYIVYDTQLILGGEHKEHQFEVDDYALASLTLFLDVVNLFIKLLKLFGEKKNKKSKK